MYFNRFNYSGEICLTIQNEVFSSITTYLSDQVIQFEIMNPSLVLLVANYNILLKCIFSSNFIHVFITYFVKFES